LGIPTLISDEPKIEIYKSKSEVKPECVVSIPLKFLHVSSTLLPKKLKDILKRESIDIEPCNSFIKEKDIKGTLIEIESPNERMIISVD